MLPRPQTLSKLQLIVCVKPAIVAILLAVLLQEHGFGSRQIIFTCLKCQLRDG